MERARGRSLGTLCLKNSGPIFYMYCTLGQNRNRNVAKDLSGKTVEVRFGRFAFWEKKHTVVLDF